MQRLVKEYLSEWKKQQRKRRRIGIAVMLLIVMVVGGVIGSLTQYGVALTGTPRCGIEEHTHDASCYTSAVTCGQEEDGGHQHTEACYTESTELTCGQEEGEEHQHGDGCYTTSSELTCGQEESAGHTHTDTCYTEELTCGMEEHTHTDDCYIDTTADVEDTSVWNEQYKDVDWKETWGENLVIAAQMQIGYKESSVNYIVSEDGSRKGYTRYGQFATNAEANAEDNPEGNTAGDVYRDWDAAFVNFCMYYAGLTSIDPKVFPENLKAADTTTWCEEFGKIREENGNYLAAPEDHTPEPGDLVFSVRENEEREGQMGIVSSYNKETNEIKVIEGNSQNEVRENTYNANDEKIVSYLMMSEIEKDYKTDGDAADEEDPNKDDADAEENPGQDDADAEETPKQDEVKEPNQASEEDKKDEDAKESEENVEGDEEESEDKIDYSNGMTLEDLEKLPEDEVGSAIWMGETATVQKSKMRRAAARNTDTWSYDAYYVGQNDNHYVEKNTDFNLKYQMEFHTNRNFSKNQISIKIKRALLEDRNKNPINPNQIAVSEVEKDSNGIEIPVEKDNMPFNYRIVTENGEEYLEFFNYRAIDAGTNIAWQILYKNLKIMQIEDEKEWKLEPTIIIWQMEDSENGIIRKNSDGRNVAEEERNTDPLEGKVNSSVELTRLTKKKYKEYNKSYTPCLYTASQVNKYIGYINEENKEKFFEKDEKGNQVLKSEEWRFVVWQITMEGKATQPWQVNIQEMVGEKGEVVGYKDDSNKAQGYDVPIDPEKALKEGVLIGENQKGSWSSRFYVVTAHPYDNATEMLNLDADDNGKNDNTLTNNVVVSAIATDGKDYPSRKQAQAKLVYEDFEWRYSGNVIGINKENGYLDNEPYAGWLEVYERLNNSESTNKRDYGDIPFTSIGELQGYQYTHHTSGPEVGQYKEGTGFKLTTADDMMCVNTKDGTSKILGAEDYYYTKVSVIQRDYGYDIWEDEEKSTIEKNDETVDQNLEIYAMYEDSSTWEPVTAIPWNSSGEMKYEFGPNELNKKPWRIKAEHVSTNYRTTCEIKVNVCIKKDSPVMKTVLTDYEQGKLDSIEFEDLSGVIGQYKGSEEDSLTLIANKRVGENDIRSESTVNYDGRRELKEATQKLYEDVLSKDYLDDEWEFPMYRDNACKEVTGLQKSAESWKEVTDSSNDVANSRGQIVYSLTAHDGYQVFNEEALTELKRTGLESPGRNEVAFYDLLPYGMEFDPSYQVTAGRITELDPYYRYAKQPSAWDRSQVEVTWETKENHNGTGRTLVIFHIVYNGADSAVYSNQKWMEGWGVSFRAYYDWKDAEIVKKDANISAFMTDEQDAHYMEPLLGTDDQVAKDNGKDPNGSDFGSESSRFGKEYTDFGSNIDGNTENDSIRSVLYASNDSVDEIVQSFQADIKKRVRADQRDEQDNHTQFRGNATVEEGGFYTYEITVSTAAMPLDDIVIYDHLENAKEDRTVENGGDKDPNYSGFATSAEEKGTLQSVITSGLEKMDINAVVYYSDKPDAEMNLGETDTWYKEEAFRNNHEGSLEAARSIAVDLGTKKDGTAFSLESNKALSFRIKMKAPQLADDTAESHYMYNAPAYKSKSGEIENNILWGNSTKVRVEKAKNLIVEKKFQEDKEIPDAVKNNLFQFQLSDTEGNSPFNYEGYILQKKDENGEWKDQKGQYATDQYGYMNLHADERAVFKQVPDVSRITVEETENIFWKSDKKDAEDKENRIVTVENMYRPVLYVQKETDGIPDSVHADSTEFTFQITTGEDVPLANVDYYYVDRVRTNGGIPEIVKDKGENGKGKTGNNGEFTIQKADIIALFPGNVGTKYKVEEIMTPETERDWICRTDVVEGTVSVKGDSVVIKNSYLWKDLYLTKAITHQNPEECNERFTFEIKKIVDGKEISFSNWPAEERNKITLSLWQRTEDGYEQIENVNGLSVDTNGRFGYQCAGKTIRISGLKANETYRIKEIVDPNSDYLPNEDTVEVKMSIGSGQKESTITNDYQYRPLLISKRVVGESLPDDTFTMQVKVDGKFLKRGTQYTLMKDEVSDGTGYTGNDGKIELKAGQTAVFEDIAKLGQRYEVTEIQKDGYKQVFPANGEAHTGNISGEEVKIEFINANEKAGNNLYIQKEYVASEMDRPAVSLKNSIKDSILINENCERRYWATVNLSVNGKQFNGGKITAINQLTGDMIELDPQSVAANIPAWNYSSYGLVPWYLIIISEDTLREAVNISPEEKIHYTLSEEPYSQHRVEKIGSHYLQIDQKEPENDKSVEGTLENQPFAIIKNEIKSREITGRITKEMAKGSEAVSPGSTLIWRVERYNGISWQPAEGISYMPLMGLWDMDPNSYDSRSAGMMIQKTDTDGIIRLQKPNGSWISGKEAWPGVEFVDDDVKINVKNPQLGDLRVVEVLNESDDEWGSLSAYKAITVEESGKKTAQKGLDLYDIQDGGFINSNKKSTVEISKQLQNGEDKGDTFTMILKQVLSTDENGKITSSEGRSGIPYILHDSKGGVREETTGKNGEILLKAGEYASVELPEGTQWTVSENIDHTYSLVNLEPEEETDTLKKLDPNLMLIRPEQETDQSYCVTYYDRGTIYSTDTILEGNSHVIKSCTNTRDGYEFIGWSYTNISTTADVFAGDSYQYSGDVNLYAVWEKKKVTLRYMLDDKEFREEKYHQGTMDGTHLYDLYLDNVEYTQ